MRILLLLGLCLLANAEKKPPVLETLNGNPIEAITDVTVNFTLSQ